MNENLVLAGADQDLFACYVRFEDRREGGGALFDHAIHEQLHLLALNPLMGPSFFSMQPLRRLVMLNWDIAIFYRVEGRRNVICAVLHLRQSAESIRAILQSRLPQ
jgi:plasmid stabilization system protein ParE